MLAIVDHFLTAFLEEADIGHLALFVWAAGASVLAGFCVREAADATRRTDVFLSEFLHELAHFSRTHAANKQINSNHDGDET
jgi:heme exporter protein D